MDFKTVKGKQGRIVKSTGGNNIPGVCWQFGCYVLATLINRGPQQLENKAPEHCQRFAILAPRRLPVSPAQVDAAALLHCCCWQERSRVNLFYCPLLISLIKPTVTTQSLCPAVLRTVDGAIDSSIHAYVYQWKYTQMTNIKCFMFSLYSSSQGTSGHLHKFKNSIFVSGHAWPWCSRPFMCPHRPAPERKQGKITDCW